MKRGAFAWLAGGILACGNAAVGFPGPDELDPTDAGVSPAEEPRCDDGAKNGDEADVDCGGSCPQPCAIGAECSRAEDCAEGVCREGACMPPAPDDGVKNGDETDIDCGGSVAPACAVGQRCLSHTDCITDGCDYLGVCALARSCTGHFGGDTCGSGELGEAEIVHESCCASLELPREDGSSVLLDKYMITAGRMRVFLERTGGNVHEAMANHPGWDTAIEEVSPLPRTMTEALRHVGPFVNDWDWADNSGNRARGCFLQNTGARTYWQNDNPAIVEAERHRYDQDQEDQKLMNCATAALFHAFCLWDGGELAMGSDLVRAWKGEDNRRWPWGNEPNVAPGAIPEYVYDARYVNRHNYGWPGTDPIETDYSFWVPAPGRRSAGAGPYGHVDLAGASHKWSLDGEGGVVMLQTGSWENHPMAGTYGPNAAHKIWNRRYYAIGARCARPLPAAPTPDSP